MTQLLKVIERMTGIKKEGQGTAFLVALGHCATHWMIGTIYIVLPFIAREFGLSYTEAGGLITIFHISAFLANAGSGVVVDITGKRVAIQFFALVIGAAGFVAFGFSTSLFGLSLAIMVVGVTNNLWHPAAISYLSLRFPENRGYALSIHSLGANLGDTIAPIIIGSLLIWLNWGITIGVSSIPVFAVALWIILIMKDVNSQEKIEEDFVVRKEEYREGLVKMLKDFSILSLCVMSGLRSMTQNGLLVFIPLYLANVLEAGPLILGASLMVMQLTGLIAGPIAGVFSDNVGRRSIVLIGLLITTIITIILGMISNLTLYILVIALLGFALFAVRPVIHSWLMDLTPKNLGGSATSLLFATQSALSAIIPLGGGVIADIWGLSIVFYLLAVFIFLATILVVFIPDKILEVEV